MKYVCGKRVFGRAMLRIYYHYLKISLLRKILKHWAMDGDSTDSWKSLSVEILSSEFCEILERRIKWQVESLSEENWRKKNWRENSKKTFGDFPGQTFSAKKWFTQTLLNFGRTHWYKFPLNCSAKKQVRSVVYLFGPAMRYIRRMKRPN